MDLPAKLLRNILWNLDQDKFGSQQDFETKLLNEQSEVLLFKLNR